MIKFCNEVGKVVIYCTAKSRTFGENVAKCLGAQMRTLSHRKMIKYRVVPLHPLLYQSIALPFFESHPPTPDLCTLLARLNFKKSWNQDLVR
jgi:hypothetical protein